MPLSLIPTLREPFGNPFRALPIFIGPEKVPWKAEKGPEGPFSLGLFRPFQGPFWLFSVFLGSIFPVFRPSDSAKLFLGSPLYSPVLETKKKSSGIFLLTFFFWKKNSKLSKKCVGWPQRGGCRPTTTGGVRSTFFWSKSKKSTRNSGETSLVLLYVSNRKFQNEKILVDLTPPPPVVVRRLHPPVVVRRQPPCCHPTTTPPLCCRPTTTLPPLWSSYNFFSTT